MKKVYLVGPITGTSYNECTDWRSSVKIILAEYNIDCFSPMRHKEHLKGESVLGKTYEHPLSTGKGIVQRDVFDVRSSDLILANFLDSKIVSIGSVMEIGMAYILHKPIVTIIKSDNIHYHPFVTEASSFITDTLTDGVDIVKKILNS